MATVTHMNVDYSCATAIKGDDYIHLQNEEGQLTVIFDGISDFSSFSITDGDWTTVPQGDIAVPDVRCIFAGTTALESGVSELPAGGMRCLDNGIRQLAWR